MIPLLAASEKGIGQTESPCESTAEMWWIIMAKSKSKSSLERGASEGDSPVFDDNMPFFNRVGLPRSEV